MFANMDVGTVGRFEIEMGFKSGVEKMEVCEGGKEPHSRMGKKR